MVRRGGRGGRMKVETFYLVTVKCEEVHSYSCLTDTPITRKNTVVYLCDDTGYPSHTANKGRAKKFKEIPSNKVIDSYNGYPWYYKHVPGSETIYKVTEWYERKEEKL
jgi:hypothetical protein